MSQEKKKQTLDEFLVSLKKPDPSLRFTVDGLEFEFNIPDTSFEGLIALSEKADEFSKVVASDAVTGELKKYKCSRDLAREASVMAQCNTSPGWKPVEFMRLQKEAGVVFAAIRREFNGWYQSCLSYEVGQAVAVEKKD